MLSDMARKPRVLLAGGIYHVTCRGNERSEIFVDNRDRERFLLRLAESAEVFQVRIHLYCLMSNHVHLLVETPLGNLDRFMGSVLTGYTVYFNLRHDRSGHLMQGRYGAQLVAGDEYLLKLGRYIHLNPVQIKKWANRSISERICQLRAYPWSSYLEYAGIVKPCGWLTTGPTKSLMRRFGRADGGWTYAKYMESGLARTDDEFALLMKERPVAIGSESFIDEIKREHLKKANQRRRKEDVSFRSIHRHRSVEEVTKGTDRVLGSDRDLLVKRKDGVVARGFFAWALQRHAGLTQRETAHHLGVTSGAAISALIKRTRDKREFKKWREELELLYKG